MKILLWKTATYALGFFSLLLGWSFSFYYLASDLKDRPAQFNLFVVETHERNGTVLTKETIVGHLQGYFLDATLFYLILSSSILLGVYVIFLAVYMLHDWRKPYSNARGPLSAIPFAFAIMVSTIFFSCDCRDWILGRPSGTPSLAPWK